MRRYIFKTLLVGSILLNSSCYLFESTPTPILNGFRETYKVSGVAERNATLIINTLNQQLKEIATYYLTRYYELRLEGEINLDAKARLEKERDELINKFVSQVATNETEHLDIIKSNFKFLNQLLEALYDYHSTEPLSISKIENIIENGKELLKKYK